MKTWFESCGKLTWKEEEEIVLFINVHIIGKSFSLHLLLSLSPPPYIHRHKLAISLIASPDPIRLPLSPNLTVCITFSPQLQTDTNWQINLDHLIWNGWINVVWITSPVILTMIFASTLWPQLGLRLLFSSSSMTDWHRSQPTVIFIIFNWIQLQHRYLALQMSPS